MPPNVKVRWDDNNVWSQSQLIAYNHIRDYEYGEEQEMMYKAMGAVIR